MLNQFSRTELLFGKYNMEKLNKAHIAMAMNMMNEIIPKSFVLFITFLPFSVCVWFCVLSLGITQLIISLK